MATDATEEVIADSKVSTVAESASGSGDDSSVKTALIVVGVVAAAVSAATAAYIFWSRHQRSLVPQVESVQDLLERAHDKMRQIEQKLGDLSAAPQAQPSTNGSGTAMTADTAAA